MSTYLFNRKYTLTIETWRGTTIDVSDLRWTFSVNKNLSRIYQFADITIYNLSPTTETDIFKNAKMVTIQAGYENGPYGVVFRGPVRQPIRGKEDGVTYFLTLVCIDGDDALNLGFSNFTLASGQTATQIANSIVRNSSVPFDINVGNLNSQQTQRGKTVFGNPGDYLRSIANANNASFYFDDTVAKISPLSTSPPAIVPELNVESGLVGMPQQTDQGIQVRTFINPNIKLDTWFKINNQKILQARLEMGQLQTLLDLDGVYRVIEINAIGDTRGNDWYYDLTAISQTGALPFLLTGANQSGV